MATGVLARDDCRTEFLSSADPKKIFRVPPNLFPLAIDPPWTPAHEARFMRPTDWVIGVCIGDEARCYPAWMMDNYHAVNDTLGGVHIAVMHCEICCSNAAYQATLNGRRWLFGTAGLYGGTLAVYDLETGSTWSHGMGVAFAGALRGAALLRIQSFQATWEEWLSLFPDSSVIDWTEPECHPDGRHGHGSQDTFAHAGMYKEPVSTMMAGNDDRLPEHEMVVTIFLGREYAALPLREIMRAGGVFHFELGGVKLVTISAGPSSALAGTFRRQLPGDGLRLLDFELRDGRVVDAQTGSGWRADGLAIEGELRGQRLEPVPTMTNKWHSLVCFLKDIPILTHQGTPVPVCLDEVRPAIDSLCQSGLAVEVDYALYTLELPNGATRGFHLQIDGHPFDLLVFEDSSVAEDDALCRPHAVQRGVLTLASSPDKRFRDNLNVDPLPDEGIAWSPLVGQQRFQHAVERASATLSAQENHSPPSITELRRALKGTDYEFIPTACCPRDAIPAGAIVGLHLTIQGEPFILYRFDRPETAAGFRDEREHSLIVGHFVLRSDPKDLYTVPAPISTLHKPDEYVSWSPLLADERLVRLLQSVCTSGVC